MIAFWLIHAVFYLLTFWLGVKYNKVLQVNGKRNGIILTIFTLLLIILITGLFNYYGLCDIRFQLEEDEELLSNIRIGRRCNFG